MMFAVKSRSGIVDMNRDNRFIFPIGDELDELLLVNITEEGIIMDVIRDGQVVGTCGMMADEWADFILERN